MRPPFALRSALLALVLAALAVGSAAQAQGTRPAASSQTDLEALYWQRQQEARERFVEADVRFMSGMIGHHAQALTMSALAPTHGASAEVQTLAARIINAQRDEIRTMQRWLRDRGQTVPEVPELTDPLGVLEGRPSAQAAHMGMAGMGHEGMGHEGGDHSACDPATCKHAEHHGMEGDGHAMGDHASCDPETCQHAEHHAMGDMEGHDMEGHDMSGHHEMQEGHEMQGHHEMQSGDMQGHSMAGHAMGEHSMGEHVMPGMLTMPQLRELAAARGAEFDRLFLSTMIQHHTGAVVMVDELFAADGAAQDDAVFKLASDVQVDQRTEIARMQLMLDQRSPAAPTTSGTP